MLLFLILFFSSFIAYIINKLGIIPSISDSFYELGKGEKPNKKHLFTITMMVVGLIVALFTITPPLSSPFWFISGFLLIAVGVAAEFREKLPGRVHVVGATGGIIFAHIAAFNPLILSICILSSVFLNQTKAKNATFWIELINFAGIITSIVLNYGMSSLFSLPQ